MPNVRTTHRSAPKARSRRASPRRCSPGVEDERRHALQMLHREARGDPTAHRFAGAGQNRAGDRVAGARHDRSPTTATKHVAAVRGLRTRPDDISAQHSHRSRGCASCAGPFRTSVLRMLSVHSEHQLVAMAVECMCPLRPVAADPLFEGFSRGIECGATIGLDHQGPRVVLTRP